MWGVEFDYEDMPNRARAFQVLPRLWIVRESISGYEKEYEFPSTLIQKRSPSSNVVCFHDLALYKLDAFFLFPYACMLVHPELWEIRAKGTVWMTHFAAVGFGKFQILVLGYAGMGWVSEAMEMMLLSFVGPALESA
ncbi:hypothetical protein E3N88_43197 [Mikania micrantha]|uniref:Uncharacterized protein n=1 Tax=Mikania micrantha TaxID=192012 RepID=A0A5N6LFJ4_9ASTR|nr:hypothetical protein E3N88_43197 [Mikania micrantha]